MKRLYVFSVRSFIGPFVVTFCISMFILIMQFLWKYIDDLMGKGISISVILELLFYVSADLIPLALPLAILLSSIMTYGNLAENNELTALKASGLSLYRIMKPLTGVMLFIALSTFYFANYVIPVSTLKWHTLIYDIQNTKISTIITPGVYSDKIDGYAIKETDIIMMTRPYICSSNYIRKMSNYKNSNWFELWDSLYWNFINKHKNILSKIYATAVQVRLLTNMTKDKLKKYLYIASKILKKKY